MNIDQLKVFFKPFISYHWMTVSKKMFSLPIIFDVDNSFQLEVHIDKEGQISLGALSSKKEADKNKHRETLNKLKNQISKEFSAKVIDGEKSYDADDFIFCHVPEPNEKTASEEEPKKIVQIKQQNIIFLLESIVLLINKALHNADGFSVDDFDISGNHDENLAIRNKERILALKENLTKFLYEYKYSLSLVSHCFWQIGKNQKQFDLANVKTQVSEELKAGITDAENLFFLHEENLNLGM